jgi:uncharacterized protein (TIGR02246 family)
MKRCVPCCLIVPLFWFGSGQARADQAEDEAAIRKMVKSYTSAFNKRDAKVVAAHWLPEAVYVDPDTRKQIVGREAIEKHFVEEFKDIKNAKLAVNVESIRFISPHVALEQGRATVTEPGKEPSKVRYSAIHVKREGKWLLDRVSDADDAPPPSNFDKLKELEWMVGSWVDNDEDDETTVEMACKWAKNQNFLVRTYTVTVREELAVSGVQMIGWDPSAKQIRSWAFDSDGGFSEGFWTKKGKSWHIQTKEIQPDGQTASAVNILSPIDNNNFTWQSIDRQSGGVLLPNIGAMPVMRKTVAE